MREKTTLRAACAFAAALIVTSSAQAGSYSVPAHSGSGRVAVELATGTAWVLAYETYIRGLEGPLFDGEAGVATAHFTAAISLGTYGVDFPPTAPIVEGNMSTLVLPAGLEVTWYYDESPNQDYTAPSTFTDGVPVARFRITTAIQVDIDPGNAPPAHSFNIMWDRYELVWSAPFIHGGVEQDLRKLMPDGFTYQHLSSNVPSFEPEGGPPELVTFPYATVGSVIESGRN